MIPEHQTEPETTTANDTSRHKHTNQRSCPAGWN